MKLITAGIIVDQNADDRFQQKDQIVYERRRDHVIIDVPGREVVLEGNTRPSKDTIKILGFRWTGTRWERKCKTEEEMEQVVRKVDAAISPLYCYHREIVEYFGGELI